MLTPISTFVISRVTAVMLIGILASNIYALEAPPEVPYFKQQVTDRTLPAVVERLPQVPFTVSFDYPDQTAGEYGGELRMLMGKAKDIRMMTVYGYARLVGFDRDLKFVPDLLESIDIIDNREFTLHLRPGHKWSDGHPFTTEDFRYYWEDIANNEELSPFGPPKALRVDDKLPEFEIIDEHTVRYTWPQPNPYFIPALAAPRPLYIYNPAHYLRQFHQRYVEADQLNTLVEEAGTRNWVGLHLRRGKQYRQDNPELPSLQPWVNTVAPPADRFVFVRNPYYHRVDNKGRQLPYIDRVVFNIVSGDLIPAKTGAGESDLQARYLRLDNYTFLKAGEKQNDFAVHLWKKATGAQIALFPNFNSSDAVWRELVRDVRFRRALSLAVNRHEVNQVIYYGLVLESNNTLLPESPLAKPEYQTKWATYDPETANQYLDELALTERDDRGVRLRPDGKPLEVIVHTAGESTEETDVLELIHDSWLDVGIKLYTKPSQREVFRNRVFSGDAMMSIWSGVDNGIASADMSPHEFAPTTQNQLQWPQWGQFYETGGNAGAAPDIDSVARLGELNNFWRTAVSHDERAKVWREILDIHSDEIFTIGVICGARQPVVVNNELRNVPKEGIYSWEPSSYFGIYRPDTFWFAQKRR